MKSSLLQMGINDMLIKKVQFVLVKQQVFVCVVTFYSAENIDYF